MNLKQTVWYRFDFTNVLKLQNLYLICINVEKYTHAIWHMPDFIHPAIFFGLYKEDIWILGTVEKCPVEFF